MGKLFGTDGVRGVANKELTPELALNLGRAGGYVLTKAAKGAPKVLVAMDSRRSGDMLAAALSAGLCSVGAEVHLAGVIPTPAVAYYVRENNFDAGVMISASHNPMADNGIKFFSGTGYKLPDALEDEIETYMTTPEKLPAPIGKDVGITIPCKEAENDYINYLLSTVKDKKLNGLKIALDCANGATSQVASKVFEALGGTVHKLSNTPNGLNINENCGSTHMENLCQYVKTNNLDLGLAFDGDGDRMLAVDNNGNMVDGDEILAICGYDLSQQGQLPQNAIVATTMSNQGLEVMCKNHGLTLHRTDVGDRYVLEKMLADNLALGGEQSGHIIFTKYSTTGDGILAGLLLVEIVIRNQKPLSELKTVMEHFPQVLINVKVANDKKRKWSNYPEITTPMKEMEDQMNGEGRILIRPSGTEPLVRVMIEGRDKADIQAKAERLADIIVITLAP
ncbi:MAG: phosphoglucosamine mutase [Defluviitaleaceae bacterium]|nr:phosphoglucosamine mutase [Defluviitaleaceae bacterium]